MKQIIIFFIIQGLEKNLAFIVSTYFRETVNEIVNGRKTLEREREREKERKKERILKKYLHL